MKKQLRMFDVTNTKPAAKKGGHKRRRVERTNGKFKSVASQEPLPGGLLWADKHSPRSVDGLCVHNKRVSEVRSWISSATSGGSSFGYDRPKLLLLCGPPGVGKSTMVSVLAKEMGIGLREWSDTGTSTGKRTFCHQGEAGGLRRWWMDQADSQAEFSAGGGGNFESQQDAFRSFLLRSSRYKCLQLLPTNASHASIAAVSSGRGSQAKSQIAVIENLPWTGSSSALSALHESLAHFLASPSTYPAVIIFSDVAEAQVNPTELRRKFSEEVLTSPHVKVMHCNPVAPGMFTLQCTSQSLCSLFSPPPPAPPLNNIADVLYCIHLLLHTPAVAYGLSVFVYCSGMMKKLLLRIAQSEHLDRPDTVAAAAAANASGDIRHAVNSLQFHSRTVAGSLSSSGGEASDAGVPGSCGHDKFLANLHSIGKLLRAKREGGRQDNEVLKVHFLHTHPHTGIAHDVAILSLSSLARFRP
jgi:DNA polymerase III delta prime subunit